MGNVLSVDDDVPQPATVRSAPVPGKISEEQEALIREGISLIVEVPWPANPKKAVGLHAVSRQDQILARAQARLSAREFCNLQKPEEQPLPDVEDMCFRDEIVQRAFCKWPPPKGDDDPDPLFGSVEEMRIKLTVAEIEALYEMHARHEAWVCPLLRAETAGDGEVFGALLADLKKKPDSDLLNRLPHATLAAFVRSLASRLPDA